MIRARTLTAGLAVAGLMAATLAFAQGPGPGNFGRGRGFGPDGFGGQGRPGGRGRLGGPLGLGGSLFNLGRLNLTDAQRQQMQDIRERSRESMQGLRERMRQAADAERDAMQALPVDEGRIRAASQALAEVSADLAVQAARLRGEVWGLLTPEQQAQVTKRRTEVQERVRERLQRFRERREQQPTQ